MEKFFSKIKNTVEVVKKTPEKFQKKFIETTGLGLNRSMPQPNPVDNTLEEVSKYRKQVETENKKFKEHDSTDNRLNNDLDIAA